MFQKCEYIIWASKAVMELHLRNWKFTYQPRAQSGVLYHHEVWMSH